MNKKIRPSPRQEVETFSSNLMDLMEFSCPGKVDIRLDLAVRLMCLFMLLLLLEMTMGLPILERQFKKDTFEKDFDLKLEGDHESI